MKFALATILFTIILIGVHAAPQTFDFAGMKGLVDTTSIVNGEKTVRNEDISKAAEDILRSMINKHLTNKKAAKKAARKEKVKDIPASSEQSDVPAPSEQAEIPASLISINWEDHPESKSLINEKIPGGTAAVDALIKLIQEQKAKQ